MISRWSTYKSTGRIIVSWQEALRDDLATPVPDQVAFRLDLPAFLKILGDRNRRLAENMALSETTKNLARKFHCTPGRISQLRKQFHDEWRRFHGEPVKSPVSVSAVT